MPTMPTNPGHTRQRRKLLALRMGVTINTIRKLRGMSQHELGKRVALSEPTMSKLFSGHRDVQLGEPADFATALEVDEEVLYLHPLDALQALGLPADVAQAFLDNTLTKAALAAITSRYARMRRRQARRVRSRAA